MHALVQYPVHTVWRVKGNETKTTRFPSVFGVQNLRRTDRTELLKVTHQARLSRVVMQATHKNFIRARQIIVVLVLVLRSGGAVAVGCAVLCCVELVGFYPVVHIITAAKTSTVVVAVVGATVVRWSSRAIGSIGIHLSRTFFWFWNFGFGSWRIHSGCCMFDIHFLFFYFVGTCKIHTSKGRACFHVGHKTKTT